MEMLEKKKSQSSDDADLLKLFVSACANVCSVENVCRCKHKMCAENCLCVCVSLRDCVPQQQQVAGPKTRQ